MLRKLQSIERIHITAPRGTDIEVGVPKEVKFDTDCIIVLLMSTVNLENFGNLPVGEVWSEKSEIITLLNKGKRERRKSSLPCQTRGKWHSGM